MSKLRSQNRRGFTLVELLVVIAVLVALLSFIEQGRLFGELSDSAVGGVGNTDIAANVNGQIFDGQRVDVPGCPSATLPQMSDPFTTTPQGVMIPTSVGISGAATRGGGPNPDAEPTCKGIMASSGILVPNGSDSFSDFSDGSTNTMLLGEQSAFARDVAGKSVDVRSSNSHGAWVGSTGSCSPGDGAWFCTNFQSWNITTVRYPVNFLDATAAAAGGATGVGPEDGANRPIQSIHTDGANVAVTDGSVRFVGESVDYTLLTNLANRNDGNEISDF